MKTFKIIRGFLFISLIILLTSQSVWYPQDNYDRAQFYTRPFEFDYFYWTIQSLWQKASQVSVGLQTNLNPPQQRRIVDDLLGLIDQIKSLDDQIRQNYANPEIKDPKAESGSLLTQKQKLEELYMRGTYPCNLSL
jgi:hypothetical protein